MLDKATITQKANQLLAELRANPDWAIDEKNFKQGYLKALEWYCQIQELSNNRGKFSSKGFSLVVNHIMIAITNEKTSRFIF